MGLGGGLWVHTWSCSPGKGPEPFGGCVWSCLLLPAVLGLGFGSFGAVGAGGQLKGLCVREEGKILLCFFTTVFFFSFFSPHFPSWAV